MSHMTRVRPLLVVLTFALPLSGGFASAQTRGGVPALPPPDGPVVINTDVVPRVRVVPIASGLSHPWGMAFRRNGDILVTERDKGTLRVIREGRLLERDIPGVPEVFTGRNRAGLMDIVLHPDDDRVVYLTYTKAIEHEGEPAETVALARGVLDGDALTKVHDIFVAKGLDDGIAASRLLFRPDGTLLMSVGGSYVFAETGDYAQDPSTHFGRRPTAIRSSATPTTCRKSTPWGTGTSSVSPFTRRRGICGRARTDPRVVTRSTSSGRAGTTAGHSPRTAVSTSVTG